MRETREMRKRRERDKKETKYRDQIERPLAKEKLQAFKWHSLRREEVRATPCRCLLDSRFPPSKRQTPRESKYIHASR